MKLSLVAVILALSSSALAADTTITDPIDIMTFLNKNPAAQSAALSASLASGVLTKVTSITYGDCLVYAGGKGMKVTLIMAAKGGFGGTDTSTVTCQ